MDLSKNIESLEASGQNAPLKTAYSYVRISTPEQRKGTGIARQVEAAEAYCQSHGLRLDITLKLSDEGVSAFKGDNVLKGKLGLFLRLLDEGKIRKGSYLICESLDRTSRASVLDAFELFLSIVNRGITLVTLIDQQVYNREEIKNNPSKLFVSLGVMIRANEESETKSKRIKDARNKRREAGRQGKPIRKWTPPWCEYEPDGFVLVKEKGRIVRRIFQMYLDGMGPQAISKTLNLEGVPSFSRGTVNACKNDTTEWYKTIVARLLVDKRLIGVAPFLDDKPDYFPKAVPADLFNRAQFRLSERARKPMPGQIGKGPVNILAGIMRCGHCHGMMAKSRCINREGYEYFYYVCENARSGKSSCEYKSVMMKTVEDAFLHLMTFRPWFEENLTENGQVEALEERIESLKGELVASERQIAKIQKLILADDNPPKSIVVTLKELERRCKRRLKSEAGLRV